MTNTLLVGYILVTCIFAIHLNRPNMPFLLNCNGRVGIMIHPGNYPKETQGCILVGRNTAKGSVTASKKTFENVNAIIQAILHLNGSVTITVQ